MKTLIMGLFIVLFSLQAYSQSLIKSNSHLYIKGEVGMMESKQRNIFDVGIQFPYSRIAVYSENFLTDRYISRDRKGRKDLPNVNYRKFFLGVRYSYIIPIVRKLNAIPSIGVDIRLNGVNTKKTASKGILGTISNAPSLRLGTAIEYRLSENMCNPLRHVSLFTNAYSQINVTRNFGKYFRPGASIGALITF